VNPFPLVLSSPSGGGKTTITRMLKERRSDVGYSISCTTRQPRGGEVDGRDYFFLSREEFEARRARGDFAENAVVHGNLYGTLRSEVTRVLSSGRHVVMDIDVQGARQFATVFPEAVSIFLLPPSADTLLARLVDRRTEVQEDVLVRVRGARQELMSVNSYQYVVVNDNLERAYGLVSAILEAESVRHARMPLLDARVKDLIADLDREILSLTHNT
jgi:guanylate kinase